MALPRRRAALGAGALGALGALGGAGARVGRAAASEPRARDPAEAAARMAQLETDPEAALEAWGFAVEADGGSALSLAGRGDCLLGLGRFGPAEEDLTRALALPPRRTGDARADAALLALLFDSRGLARLASGRAAEAREDFGEALGAAAAGGAAGADVPDAAPLAGLRGGPPTLGQRIGLHAALATWEERGAADALAALAEVDDGPDPLGGQPQFWEVRAARVAALSAAGEDLRAERAWAALCAPADPNPPSVPTNPLFALVNKGAVAMLEGADRALDNSCESFESGVPMPCNDAGIPGLGGASAPCALFTPAEARARMWPAAPAAALAAFRAGGTPSAQSPAATGPTPATAAAPGTPPPRP